MDAETFGFGTEVFNASFSQSAADLGNLKCMLLSRMKNVSLARSDDLSYASEAMECRRIMDPVTIGLVGIAFILFANAKVALAALALSPRSALRQLCGP